ncbi:MAG: metallophosphoesterase [Firmicutes bacterium]|nr:metallophosphoesterase [Bacillota bacterium]
MSLYAIGDLHLAFGSEIKAPMQLMGKVWIDHEKKFKENCARELTDADTLVLVGDHSWGRNLEECALDLEYIMALPGRKILLRGNHDMFWDAKKTAQLNERFAGKLEFLQNNYYAYGDYALVGTKGYCYEGKDTIEHAEMLVERELERLRISFEAAKADGFRKYIMFLHYPPTNIFERNSGFTKIAEKYGAEQVIYAHCHGEQRFHDSIRGKKRGIRYSLVSGDCLRWHPMKVLD